MALVIGYDGYNWSATLQGTDIYYFFAGSGDTQAAMVKAFATSMTEGSTVCTSQIGAMFSNLPPGQPLEVTYRSIFEATTDLMLGRESVWSCVVEESLAEELEEAGAALLALL